MTGIFMLSIDVELAWGFVHRKRIDLKKAAIIATNVRSSIDNLIALLEEYNIPVTWNILGHLVLDHCGNNKMNPIPHPDMPRPNYTWSKSDWYRFDPCTDVKSDPAWYGKDIVDKIVHCVKTSRFSHEIGYHSFSHQQFGDPGCGKELARAELRKGLEIMRKEYNILPTAFAFPRDYVGHLDVLKEHGFITFRDIPAKLYPCLRLEKTISNYAKTYSSLFAQFLSYYLLYPPHVVTPSEPIKGLVGVAGCLAYGKKPLVPLDLVTFKAIYGINKAIREGKIFSMYTHLRYFDTNRDFFSNLEKVLVHASERREEGELEVKTMSELSKEYSRSLSR